MTQWRTIEGTTSCETAGCDWSVDPWLSPQARAAAGAAHKRKHPDHQVLTSRVQIHSIQVKDTDGHR